EHLDVTPDGPLAIDLIEHLGGVSYVYLHTSAGARLIAEAKEGRSIQEGSTGRVTLGDNPVYFFDAQTQARLR
ncbi:MAG: ABC transporter ATP-binding protein, partial [Pseudomonadota bacterium]